MRKLKIICVFHVLIGVITGTVTAAADSFFIENTFYSYNNYNKSGIVCDGQQFIYALPSDFVSQVWKCDDSHFVERGACENKLTGNNAKTWGRSEDDIDVICLYPQNGRSQEILIRAEDYPVDIFAVKNSLEIICDGTTCYDKNDVFLKDIADIEHCYPFLRDADVEKTEYVIVMKPVGFEVFSRELPVYRSYSDRKYYLRFDDDYYLEITGREITEVLAGA